MLRMCQCVTKPSIPVSDTQTMSTTTYLQHFLILLLLLYPNLYNAKRDIINFLPGYPDELPFHLETGYVGVGETEQVQSFYYFIESEGDPQRDPLFLWLTGGPGCSAFSGLVLEIGPLNLNISAPSWQSEPPKFQLNPFSWTKVASVIFLDSPVGTGFSYATTPGGYYSDDMEQASHIYEFLKKWLADHPEYKDNTLYISGDSYCGKIVPIIVQNILDGNKAGLVKMNLKGYILGNPYTRKEDSILSKYEYARRASLIPDELYESCKMNCYDTCEDVDAHNVKCERILQDISYNLDPLFDAHVLKPKCLTPETPCQEFHYQLMVTWANNRIVQEALQIREGSKTEWIRCNKTLAYEQSVESTVGYHQNFTKESMTALVYSGDQDLKISYVATLGWIKNLNIATVDDWRPWFVGGQVAGYTTKFSNGGYYLTFATVKGAGHTAPEYKRQECLTMIKKWLTNNPL